MFGSPHSNSRPLISALAIVASLSLLASCASRVDRLPQSQQPPPALATAYDYQLLDRDFHPTALTQMTGELRVADVIFIGEYHGNHASHLLEMQILAATSQHNQSIDRPTVLSMEMFTRDQQPILNSYLNSAIGERYLVDETPVWPNYKGSYRPLVEYAKQHRMPVVAANASGDIVRCIGRRGSDYLDKLDAQEKTYIAQRPFAEVPGYDDKFFSVMAGSNHSPSERLRQSYLAQLTRDNTMAESIANALQRSPGAQVVHINGSFHSEGHLGTAGALKRMRPDLNIVVITPVHVAHFAEVKQNTSNKDDYYYRLNAQPQEFVDKDYMKKKRRAMFDTAREKAKACK